MRGRRTIGFGVALAMLVSGVAWTPAADAAIVVCKKKAKLKLRDGACKSNEQAVQLAGSSVDPTTLGQVPSAAQAGAATDAGTLDGLDSTSFQQRARWALVSADGTQIIAQSGGISIVPEPITGIYVLDFVEDLRGRAVVATVRGGLTNKGWAQVAICGGGTVGGPEVSFCNVGGSVLDEPHELAIGTLDPDGTPTDRSFYVAVLP